MAKTKAPKEEDIKDPEDLEEEEEEEEEEEPKKKKPSAKKEDTPEWAKTIIKLLTPKEQIDPKTIPVPKPPKPPEPKEEEVDQEKNNQQPEDLKPKQTFLGWFW
jgi:hypothetical protein